MWAESGNKQGIAEPETQRALIHEPKLFFYEGIVDKTAVLMLIFPVIRLHSDNNTASRNYATGACLCIYPLPCFCNPKL